MTSDVRRCDIPRANSHVGRQALVGTALVLLCELSLTTVIAAAEPLRVRAHDRWISSVAMSGDGKRIITGSDDPSIKVVLEEVNRRTLCLALKAAGDDVKSAVCRNLAAAEADDLRNEIGRMGAVRLHDIEKAQASVAAVMASCRVARQAETIV